jgi:hypothetical protein
MNLLSENTINLATGSLNNLFDTMARTIVINKEPIQIINTGVISSNPNPLFGYGDSSIPQTEITYQPISGSFPAVVVYKPRLELGSPVSESTKIKNLVGNNYIKVRADARDFIENGGKVESIYIDGRTWKLGDSKHIQYFLGLTYFYYLLEETL